MKHKPTKKVFTIDLTGVRSAAKMHDAIATILTEVGPAHRTRPYCTTTLKNRMVGRTVNGRASRLGEPKGGASRPSLPTVGADHRTARRCGKIGTCFATSGP